MDTIPALLVDARNWDEVKDGLIEEIRSSGLIGFDIETQDSDRHQGLNDFMKGRKKLVFDVNRTVVCGFSWYCDGGDTAYYLNLNHADVENRIPWEEARQILDAKPDDANWVVHNGPFEITMMRNSLGYELEDVICTLQMAVSTFNADQYPVDAMLGCGFGGLQSMLMPIGRAFVGADVKNMNEEQSELAFKVLSKTSNAAHSYNGLTKSLSYGYGLKGLTKQFFGYEQTSFEETLQGREHMGQMTGEEVCDYGADDAYWCMKLLHQFLPIMAAQNDQLIDTFFQQENPMIYVFADVWSRGLLIDEEAVEEYGHEERANYAEAARKLHAWIGKNLPYPTELNEGLLHDSWYKKNPYSYRKKLETWAKTPLPADDLGVIASTSGPVFSSLWDKKKSTGPNLSYYMTVRSLMYDLTEQKPRFSGGKVASNKDARDRMRGRGIDELLDILDELAGIEQRMKLYLNPYQQLIDPETSRVYPVISSKLNSRRMGMSDPNGMQLSKEGPIRSFYQADEEDHVIVALDWCQVELVLIGDQSGDPGFAEAFGQIPYQDLHYKAAAGALGMSVEELKARPDAKKIRKDIGKPANFGYWYSGALGTVADVAGWSEEQMWSATEKYREQFSVAEQWRQDTIAEAREKGYVTLPDGHRRNLFESTYRWQAIWRNRWEATNHPGLINFGNLFIQKIQTRAGNQIVNSMIQGSCATLAKRSILEVNKKVQEKGLRARFLMPIHDELVFSVHIEDVLEFLPVARKAMCDHPEIVKNLKLDATAAVGRNFGGYDKTSNPYGQIELDEANPLDFIPEEYHGQRLDNTNIQKVLDYLKEGKCLVGAQ